MGEVSFFTAFLAGIASFLSPCVLPLVPGYLSYITGTSIEEMTNRKTINFSKVFFRSLSFIIGFSSIFIIMGAAATALGSFISQKITIFNKIAGLLIIFFGLQLIGIFRLRFLMADRRYHGTVWGGYSGAALLGMAFAFGWSPCVGPILFAILAYASTQEKVWQGITLLSFYSLGIGIPLLIIGTGVGTFIRFLDRFSKYLRWVEVASGVLLVFIGFLVITGNINWLTGLFPQEWILFE